MNSKRIVNFYNLNKPVYTMDWFVNEDGEEYEDTTREYDNFIDNLEIISNETRI